MTVHTESLFQSATFWVAVSFFLFMWMAIKLILPIILKGLDKRGADIENMINEATELKKEAQQILANAKKTQAESEVFATKMLDAAKNQVADIVKKAENSTNETIRARKKEVLFRIKKLESDAQNEIRDIIIDKAVGAAGDLLTSKITANGNKDLCDSSLEKISSSL